MSEANTPFNPPDQSQAASDPARSDAPDWQEPAVLKGDGPVLERQSEGQPEDGFDLSHIFDASELEDLTFEAAEAPQAANRSSIAAWLQEPAGNAQPQTAQADNLAGDNLAGDNLAGDGLTDATAATAQTPNLADLVNLIQELNQCNGLLMDRVSQLEEALELSQTALQDEVGRTQGSDSDQDWSTVQEQVTNLFNQLEFAHQTNQRQQIVIETLTGQLENSQERAAELEREAALIQQRYSEQSQLLAKSEHTSRDLQARLQRQQRYTLQFKAALEKSLEVPTPQYEVGLNLEPVVAEAPLAAALFLPKAKRIQPWSAQTHASKAQPLSKSPWMKFQNQSVALGAAGELAALSSLLERSSLLEQSSLSAPTPELEPSPGQVESVKPLNLPSFEPSLGLLHLTVEPPTESLNHPDLEASVPDPALKQQLDEAVKPLADLLAEALLSEALSEAQSEPPHPLLAQPLAQPPAAWSVPAPAANLSRSASLAPTDETTADELLAAVMADAEDALWQDLARLIDVSAEDVVKASLSGDLAAFETLDFNALQPTNEPQLAQTVSDPSVAIASNVAPNAVTVAPLLRRLQQSQAAAQAEAEVAASEQSGLNAGLNNDEASNLTVASWPSPIVYPLRPVKKRQSLAMVDLPSFPKG